MGSGALDIQNGSSEIVIQGNRIHDISGSGIQVGDFNHTDAHPEDERVIVRKIRILNNHIYDIGMEFKGSIGVTAGFVQDTCILHNEIHDVAYSGISLGWGWGFWDPDGEKRTKYAFPAHYPKYGNETVSRRNRIECNHVYHAMMRLHDGGGIYTLSLQPESTILGNCIHDNGGYTGQKCRLKVLNNLTQPEGLKEIRNSPGFPGGIYLDEASGGFTLSENIVYRVPVAFFYHDIGIPGRFETNQVLENHFDDPSFMGMYGLEEQFRGMI